MNRAIVLVDGLGHWIERHVGRILPPYYNVVAPRLAQFSFFGHVYMTMATDDIVIFTHTRESDYLGRPIYRLRGAPVVALRYPRTEPEDDIDHALAAIITQEWYKELKDNGLEPL